MAGRVLLTLLSLERGEAMLNDERPAVFNQLLRSSTNGIPKYRLLMDAITQGIASGYWKAGDKLPTEDDLVEMIPFSLGTIQRALRILADQGVVVREHGLGTFVAESHLRIEDPWHCRFIADDGESFLPIYSSSLERDYAPETGEWTKYFNASAQRIIQIERVININDEFNVFTRFYVDKQRFPLLWNTPLEKLNGLSFKKQIATDLKMPITKVDHFVKMVQFDEVVADHTNVKPSSLGICLAATAYMGLDNCVYFQKFFIPPTTRILSIPGQPGSNIFGNSSKGQR